MARRRTKKQIFGQALSGFGEGYMSAWVPMEQMRLREKDLDIEEESLARQEHVDYLREIKDAAEGISTGFKTPEEIPAIVESLHLMYPDIPKEQIETQLTPHLQPLRQRRASSLGEIEQLPGGFIDASRDRAEQAFRTWGVPKEQYELLRPIPESISAGQFGPPEFQAEWGGPLATEFEARKKQALSAEEATHERQRRYTKEAAESEYLTTLGLEEKYIDRTMELATRRNQAVFEEEWRQEQEKLDDEGYRESIRRSEAGDYAALTPGVLEREEKIADLRYEFMIRETIATRQPQIETRIDPVSREKAHIATWINPETEQVETTLLEDVPDNIIPAEMKRRLKNTVEYSPFLQERPTSFLDALIESMLPGVLNENGSLNPVQLQQVGGEVAASSGGTLTQEQAVGLLRDRASSGGPGQLPPPTDVSEPEIDEAISRYDDPNFGAFTPDIQEAESVSPARRGRVIAGQTVQQQSARYARDILNEIQSIDAEIARYRAPRRGGARTLSADDLIRISSLEEEKEILKKQMLEAQAAYGTPWSQFLYGGGIHQYDPDAPDTHIRPGYKRP